MTTDHKRRPLAQRASQYLNDIVRMPIRLRNAVRDLREILHLAKTTKSRLDNGVDQIQAGVNATHDVARWTWTEARDYRFLKFQHKQGGYELARTVYHENLKAGAPESVDLSVRLGSQPANQDAVQSDWFRYWMEALKLAPIAHRKLWEFAYILQNFHHHGVIGSGRRGLGFGCGEEPLPAFFAAKGAEITVTDLHPQEVVNRGWAETGQHTAGLMSAFKPQLIDEETFRERVSLKYVDMNDIPSDLDGQYDFCWSVCALEHLGSIENGLNFIEESLRSLKPGGVAIHTTEFNYQYENETIDNHPTVLFRRRDFEAIAARLKALGHDVAPLSFDVGAEPLDAFVDVPPYGDNNNHLKLSVDGYPSTCFGITVKKAG